jgi:hypothetical protein
MIDRATNNIEQHLTTSKNVEKRRKTLKKLLKTFLNGLN